MKSAAVKQIRELVKEGREDEVTKDLLLKSLAEQGIKGLDDLAEHGLQAYAAAKPRPSAEFVPGLEERRPMAAIAELLFGKAATDSAKGTPHAAPKLPFVLGERSYRPAEISKFNGKPVHYLWDADTIGGGLLRAVVDPQEYIAFAEAAPAPGPAGVRQQHVPGRGHSFFQHVNFGGYGLNLGYRHAFPNLTQVTMSGWWFWATSWNDQISSVRTGSGPVILGEHIMNPYLTGATMTIGANASVSWIGAAWNDRVSCILG